MKAVAACGVLGRANPTSLGSSRTLWLGAALLALSACAVPPRSLTPERPLEERAGQNPARGLVALTGEDAIPVRFRVGDAVYAFFVFPGPRLAAWAKDTGAKLDVGNGAIVRPGAAPVLLANARDLNRRMTGPQNAWAFSEQLDLWAPLDGGATLEHMTDEEVAELEPGLPWHAVRLELDEQGEGIDIDVEVGGAYWRYVMNQPDDDGPVRFSFEAKPQLLRRSAKLDRVRDATLLALDELPAGTVLLENMHGLSVDPGPLLSPAAAQRLFDEVKHLEGVPWEVTDDGCGERAMIAAAHMAERGVRSVKVFVVGDLVLPGDDRNVEWSFHVAPAVFVSGGDGVEVVVLDPAISRAPLPLGDWLARFVSGPVVVDVLPWFQRNAVEWGGFEREADAADNVARAREALVEVVAEWHHEKAQRALEDAAAERAQASGGQRPALAH